MQNGTLVGTGTLQPDAVDQKLEQARNLICKFDGYPFTDKQSVLDHFNKRHPKETVQRDISLFMIENPFHTDNKFLKEKFECEECGHQSPSIPHLRQHEKNQHGKRALYDPDATPKFVKTPKGIQKTKTEVENLLEKEIEMIECDICGREYQQGNGILIHKARFHKVHTLEKEQHYLEELFKCDICGQEFQNTKAVKTHRFRKHIKIKIFDSSDTCDICKQKLKNWRGVKRHKYLKHGISVGDDSESPREITLIQCEFCRGRVEDLDGHMKRIHPKKIKAHSKKISPPSKSQAEPKSNLGPKPQPAPLQKKLETAQEKSSSRKFNVNRDKKSEFSEENATPSKLIITVHLAPAQIVGIEDVIEEGWYTDRAEFIRAAITDYLKLFGIIRPTMRD